MDLKKSQNISIAILNSGLVNNPNACIKDMRSSFVCCCDKCSEEQYKKMIKMLVNFNK